LKILNQEKMKITITIILFIHGLIHFMGFAKAFDYGDMAQFTKEISKPMGLLWLLTGLLFILTAALKLSKREVWPIIAIIAVVLSQVLIIMAWTDAKYGTLANVIILVAVVLGFAALRFENGYKKDVSSAMEKTDKRTEIITEEVLEPLPRIVQRYLNYVGVVGKPKVYNMKMSFEGEMRDKGQGWFKFTSEQYSFFDTPTRLFFMKAKVKGLPTTGYHAYGTKGASMLIKIASLFPVVQIDEPEMYPTETVTYFNDLCLFAPVALIDDRITWEALDDTSAKATFTTNNTRISAILYFNEIGQLINFISNDRYSVSEMKTFPFSTPANTYKNIEGYNLPTYGEAVWHYPDGEFVYGKFHLKNVEYNVPDLKE
jgi:hypothetical protein